MSLTLKRSAKKHKKIYDIYLELKKDILEIEKFENLKNDRELLNSVCNFLENRVNTKKYNINKKDLCLELYNDIFKLTEDEKITLSNDIEYLWEKGDIKKDSTLKIIRKYTYVVFKNLFFFLIK